MHLIDISAQRFTPGRKKRNEACYLHLLETAAFTAGVFVDAMTMTVTAIARLHSWAPRIHALVPWLLDGTPRVEGVCSNRGAVSN